jgi:hypothetical protein
MKMYFIKGILVGEQQIMKKKPRSSSEIIPKHMIITMSMTRLHSLVKLHLRLSYVLKWDTSQIPRNLEAAF